MLTAPAAKVDRQVFGVGDTVENYQKQTLVERIRRRAPKAPVSFVHKTEDPRDYRVDFAKIRKTLGFRPTRRLDATIDEIVDGIQQKLWQDPYAARHKNV
jgi:nucleoside-diphosphate-sugar epimerase